MGFPTIPHEQFDFSQLTGDPVGWKPIDSVNDPNGPQWGSLGLKYGDSKHIRVDLGVMRSVKLQVPPPDPKNPTAKKEAALLCPLEAEHASQLKWGNGLQERQWQIEEEQRMPLKFGTPQLRAVPMAAFSKPIIGIKCDDKGNPVPDKAPVVFLKMKPWTKFFKPNGDLFTDDEKNDLFKGIFTFNAIVKIVYIYVANNKCTLQWNLDEATVMSYEPRGAIQTVTPAVQKFLQSDPEGIEKLQKVLDEAKAAREKNREKLGQAITGQNMGLGAPIGITAPEAPAQPAPLGPPPSAQASATPMPYLASLTPAVAAMTISDVPPPTNYQQQAAQAFVPLQTGPVPFSTTSLPFAPK